MNKNTCVFIIFCNIYMFLSKGSINSSFFIYILYPFFVEYILFVRLIDSQLRQAYVDFLKNRVSIKVSCSEFLMQKPRPSSKIWESDQMYMTPFDFITSAWMLEGLIVSWSDLHFHNLSGVITCTVMFLLFLLSLSSSLCFSVVLWCFFGAGLWCGS